MGDTVLALVQLPPPLHGAATVNMQVVSSSLLNASFRVVAIPIQLSASIREVGGVGVQKLVKVMRNVARTEKALRRERPRLVYFALPPCGGGFYANLPLVALAKAFRTPLLYHLHGKGVRAAAKSYWYRTAFAWATRGAHIIVLSERLYDDVSDHVAKEQVFFLPNAVAPLPARAEGAAREGRHILFLSNLIASKGPLTVLDALALLKRRGIAFQASFAGSPSETLSAGSFENAVARLGLQEVVHYLGPVVGEDKQDLLRRSDILAFPTCNDAFPLVVLEAMGAGLAVVATPEGAIPDMVRDGETGILVPHRDPEKLANALQRLLEDPALCRSMGRRGQDVVRSEFSPEIYHRRMKEIWDRVACRQA